MSGTPERSKRSLGSPWIEVPQLLDSHQFKRVGTALQTKGLAFDSQPVTLVVDKYHQDVEYDLYLRRDQAEAGAKILRRELDLEDPDDEPFDGPCPACKARVTKAFSCPS